MGVFVVEWRLKGKMAFDFPIRIDGYFALGFQRDGYDTPDGQKRA